MVGVEIPLGRLNRLMSEDLLKHMQSDTGVGDPRCPGVP